MQLAKKSSHATVPLKALLEIVQFMSCSAYVSREQYCINDKEAAVLDRRKRRGLLGCFSDHQVRIPSP
jgi:hypothetical protein